MSTSQSGCSFFSKHDDLSEMQVRRAAVVENDAPKKERTKLPVATLVNPDSALPNELPSGVKTRYSSVHTDEQVIAFTFDDGPHPVNTPKLLDMLKERNIKATFFLVGERVRMYPQIVRRIVAEGHEIGNHTYTHISLTSRSDDQIRVELQKSADALKEVAGYTAHLMRPPYGATSKRVEQWIFSEFGYTSILWSVDPQDWRKPGVSVVQNRLLAGAHKGAIMLTHDIHASTITAVPKVFDDLLAKGYRFITVSQLLNLEKQTAPVGVITSPVDQLPSATPVIEAKASSQAKRS